MVVKQSSIANRNDFLINCHGCGRIRNITPDELARSNRIVKIFGMEGLYIYQCECGDRFNVKLDFRRKPRVPCDISSFYTTLTRTSYGRKLNATGQNLYQSTVNSVIKNISVEGIGLQTHGRHDIKPGDELLVTILLRKAGKERLLERRVVVRTVQSNYIGAEFFSNDKKNPDIGFYLMAD